MKKMKEIHNYQHRKPIKKLKERLKELNIIPQTDIDFYPEYPTGWMAAVGAYNRVYIFRYSGCPDDKIDLIKIQPVIGFNKAGGLII